MASSSYVAKPLSWEEFRAYHLREWALRKDHLTAIAHNLMPAVGIVVLGWSGALTLGSMWLDGLVGLGLSVALLVHRASLDPPVIWAPVSAVKLAVPPPIWTKRNFAPGSVFCSMIPAMWLIAPRLGAEDQRVGLGCGLGKQLINRVDVAVLPHIGSTQNCPVAATGSKSRQPKSNMPPPSPPISAICTKRKL